MVAAAVATLLRKAAAPVTSDSGKQQASHRKECRMIVAGGVALTLCLRPLGSGRFLDVMHALAVDQDVT
jgi:hypothetical protein